ncbi:MAG: hypothetical protein LBI15_02810 [Dysgonamonadaceae bacterium]|jgi:hypothetical protein|nr:hypothetical protein [Dysgonamonadaceae bacterium]
MKDIQYEGLLGILFEINKKIDTIQAGSKMNENQPAHQSVSKEEIEAIVKEKTDFLGHYFEYKHKIQTEHHSKIASEIKTVAGKIDALPTPEKISLEPIMELFPQPKKVAICGFEFLQISVIIFVLALICFFSLTLNIKQVDDCRALKIQLYHQTEYILHLENTKEEE